MAVSVIVLAAGQDSRMRSTRPKPLHLICGRPMVMHVIHALEGLDIDRTVVVVGPDGERITKKVHEQAPAWATVSFVEQPVRRGSADAALVGLSAFDTDDLDDTSTVIVLPDDRPLLRRDTLTALVQHHEASGNAATIVTLRADDAPGARRVLRAPARSGEGRVMGIHDPSRASAGGDPGADDSAAEAVAPVYAFRRDLLAPALRRLLPDVERHETFLADVIGELATMGHQIGAMHLGDPSEALGVDDRWQLALVERELRARTNRRWLLDGVTMLDPRQTFIDVTVELGRDITLFPGTMLQGRTIVGDGSEIGPHTRLVDCLVGSGCVVQNTVAEDAEIGDHAKVGPFAHLAPGASVDPNATTGPFYTGVSD